MESWLAHFRSAGGSPASEAPLATQTQASRLSYAFAPKGPRKSIDTDVGLIRVGNIRVKRKVAIGRECFFHTDMSHTDEDRRDRVATDGSRWNRNLQTTSSRRGHHHSMSVPRAALAVASLPWAKFQYRLRLAVRRVKPHSTPHNA